MPPVVPSSAVVPGPPSSQPSQRIPVPISPSVTGSMARVSVSQRVIPKLEPSLPHTAPLKARTQRNVFRLIQGLYLHDSLDAASGMAFHFFLSLMPLLVVLGFVLGHVVQQHGVDVLLDPLLDATPSLATDLVKRELQRMAGQHAALAPVGFIGFLWLASSGVHGLMNAFETAVGAPRRKWWKKRVISMAWVSGVLVSICTTAAMFVSVDSWLHRDDPETPAAEFEPDAKPVTPAPTTNPAAPANNKLHPHAGAGAGATPIAPPSAPLAREPSHETNRERADRLLHGDAVRRHVMRFVHAPWERLAAGALALTLSVVGLAAFYRFAVAHPPGLVRRYWPGSLLAMALFLLISWFFGMYVSTLGQYALYYGGLAAVAVLLFWFYLTSLALLIGAELNAQLEGIRD